MRRHLNFFVLHNRILGQPPSILSLRAASSPQPRQGGSDTENRQPRSVAARGSPFPQRSPDVSPQRQPTKTPPRSNQFHGMTVEELGQELLRHGRRKADAHHTAAALDEMIARVSDLTISVFRDACYMANLAGAHHRCVELTMKRKKAVGADVHGWSLYEAAVDSAFEVSMEEGSLSPLVDAVAAAIPKLTALPDEVPSELAAFRALWRIFVFEKRKARELTRGTSRNAVAANGSTKRAESPLARSRARLTAAVLGAAEQVVASLAEFNDSIAALCRGAAQNSIDENTTAAASAAVAVSPAAPLPAGGLSMAAGDNRGALLGRLRRLVLHSSSSDDGEQVYYALCHEHFFRCRAKPTATLCIAMLRSCRASSGAVEAMEYFQSFAAGQPGGGVDEIVVHTVIQTLNAAKDYAKVVALMTDLMSKRNYVPSVSVMALAMKAAGETQNAALATAGFNHVLSSPSGSPTAFEVFTCLFALAKCGVPDFSQILNTCVTSKLIAGHAEETGFLRLQHAMNTPEALDTVALVLGDLAASGLEPTERVMTLVLQIELRCEAPNFLERLDGFAALRERDGLPLRKQWVDLLVLWADRRRYFLQAPQLASIVSRLRAFGMTDLGHPSTDGLRTQIATILEDARHKPLDEFRRTGKAVTPPPSGGGGYSGKDTRCYFLRAGRKVLDHRPRVDQQLLAAPIQDPQNPCYLPDTSVATVESDGSLATRGVLHELLCEGRWGSVGDESTESNAGEAGAAMPQQVAMDCFLARDTAATLCGMQLQMNAYLMQ